MRYNELTLPQGWVKHHRGYRRIDGAEVLQAGRSQGWHAVVPGEINLHRDVRNDLKRWPTAQKAMGYIDRRWPRPLNESFDFGYRQDNPVLRSEEGQEWLARNREEAEMAHPRRKMLVRSVTASMGNHTPMWLPVDVLATIPGAREEQRQPGEGQFDRLLATVEREGYRDTDAVLIGVNHQGEAYIVEGNTRVAISKHLGRKYVRAEVRWYNGAEMVDGKWSPEFFNSIASAQRIDEGKWWDESPTITLYHGTSSVVLDAMQEHGLCPIPDLKAFAREVLVHYIPEKDWTPELLAEVDRHAVREHGGRGGEFGPVIFTSNDFKVAAGYAKANCKHGGEVAHDVYTAARLYLLDDKDITWKEFQERPAIPPRFEHGEPVVIEVEVPKDWVMMPKEPETIRANMKKAWDEEKNFTKRHDSFEELLDDVWDGKEFRVRRCIPLSMITKIHRI